MKAIRTPLAIISLVVIGFVMTGCKDPNDDLAPVTPSGGKETPEYTPTAQAGVSKDITKSQDPTRLATLVASSIRWGHRDNPFALTPDELAFDKQQASEKILSEQGNFQSFYELEQSEAPDAQRQQLEPQPYRRLSGILIGDSVLAILEEGGRSTIIRPGMMIPDSEWRVVSIDRDKAVLRREGNRLPREVEVRLEVGLPGTTSTPAGGGGFNPGSGGPPGVPGGKGGGPGGRLPD